MLVLCIFRVQGVLDRHNDAPFLCSDGSDDEASYETDVIVAVD